MILSKQWIPDALAIVTGGVIWLGLALATGTGDPMSREPYWWFGYPAMVLMSCLLGFLFKERSWRYGIYMLASQFIIGLWTAGGDLNLLPLGLVVFAVLAVPTALAGVFGAFLSGRFRQ